jgi:hypothetical protein
MFTFKDIEKINYDNRCRTYNIYKDILVLLDEDLDSRIYNFIDSLGNDSKSLCAVMENEGRLFLLWQDIIPDNYIQGKEISVNCNHFCPVEYEDVLSDEELDLLLEDYVYPKDGLRNDEEINFHNTFWNEEYKCYGQFVQDTWTVEVSISL